MWQIVKHKVTGQCVGVGLVVVDAVAGENADRKKEKDKDKEKNHKAQQRTFQLQLAEILLPRLVSVVVFGL